MTIRYQDDLVLCGDRWLFSRRELVVNFTHTFEAGGLPADVAVHSRGTRND